MSDTDSKTSKWFGISSSGSLWGVMGGIVLGIGIAVSVTTIAANAPLFLAIVAGSSLMGMVFGNAMDSILSGEQGHENNARQRNLNGGDLEQSHELIEHLRLRETEVKQRIEQEEAEARRRPAPTQKPSFSDSGKGHFQTLLNAQTTVKGITPAR
jgi:hypothetical protein